MKPIYAFNLFIWGMVTGLNLFALSWPDNMPDHVYGSWPLAVVGICAAIFCFIKVTRPDN